METISSFIFINLYFLVKNTASISEVLRKALHYEIKGQNVVI